MAYFRNATVNLLNLHYGIHAIGLSGGGAFFAVYLLKAGVPAAGVFLALAAILIGRFVIRPLIIGMAVRWGLRALLIAGSLVVALEYPLLADVNGAGPLLYLLCAIVSAGDVLYWSTYHAYFAALGDNEHRGHQIGAREAAAALAGIVSPLATGWLLVAFGAQVAFATTAVILALAALPLLWTPDVRVAREAPGAFRAALPGFHLFLCDGWIGAGFVFVWQIALFLSLGESIMAFGGALAIAAVVGALAGLFLGRHIDGGHGGRAVWIAYGTFAAIILFRASATHNAGLAVLANAFGPLGTCLYTPTLMTAVYTLAKRSPCTLRFHVVTEGGWDVGGAGGLLAAALFTHLGLPLWSGLLLALPGVAGAFVLLRGYYGAQTVTAAAPAI